jgi:hypothetical protein
VRTLLLVVALLVACGPARRDDDETTGGSGDPADVGDVADAGGWIDSGSPRDAGSPHDAGSSGGTPTCSLSTDCPYWYCECRSGPPVNSRRCVNNVCQNAAQGCPAACENFQTCWTGYAEGGWDGGTNVGPNACRSAPDAGTPHDAGTPVDAGPAPSCGDGTSFTDLGKACTYGTECLSSLCYGTPSYSLVCTKRCTSASTCPSGWKCLPNSNGFNICMIGSPTSSTVSTNTGCAQVSFSDVGQSCTAHNQCQSQICMNAGYCSRRCESSADCGSLHCGDVNGGVFKACLR